MARDPLRVLLTVRQQTADQARQALAECLKLEAALVDAIRAIDQAAQRELQEAERSWHRGGMPDLFAAWRKRAQLDRRAAVAALAAAESRTAEARAVLASARSGARVVEQLIEQRAAAARATAAEREQHALDDIARARRPTRRVDEEQRDKE